jgi:uncharacterized membrane protein
MKRLLSKIMLMLFFVMIPFQPLFGEGKPATELNKRVKTEGLSGLNLFLAETYNDNRLLYALVSTLTVVILGVIITYFVSLILKPKAIHDKVE